MLYSAKFSSLSHLINEESLSWCYGELKKQKSPGIDGVTVQEYGEKLEGNLKDLVTRMKSKKYRPKPVRRVYIPKADKKEKRGLGISAVEDKLVQLMLKKILEAIYEQEFLSCSYGFRPKKSCHQAVNALDKVVMTKAVNYIVEVDIEKFFDNVSHYWLLRCLEERIVDENFLILVRRFLRAGIIENGNLRLSKLGTPQGSIASPILANIFLHFVLDIWFERVFKPNADKYVELIRYCDDFVVCCESKEDAENFLNKLEERFAKFKLKTSKEKTRIIKFGRKAWESHRDGGEKVASFDFLGFTHYCTKSRRGKFIMGHKTSKRKLAESLKQMNIWLKKIRNMFKLRDWWKVVKKKLIGHYNYFGISGNHRCLRQYYISVSRLLYKWINRRSQKRSMTYEIYRRYLGWNPLPLPKIYHDMYTLSRSM
ncbi:group II intron reverse transcriptase/maturase [bacterium]